jgi:hypothetical protein
MEITGQKIFGIFFTFRRYIYNRSTPCFHINSQKSSKSTHSSLSWPSLRIRTWETTNLQLRGTSCPPACGRAAWLYAPRTLHQTAAPGKCRALLLHSCSSLQRIVLRGLTAFRSSEGFCSFGSCPNQQRWADRYFGPLVRWSAAHGLPKC